VNKNIGTLLLLIFLLLLTASAWAQPAKQIPRIGLLRSGSTASHVASHEAFRAGLRELGYEEGKNIQIEYRYAEGKTERWPALVNELVGLKVDVIVTAGAGLITAARQASQTIPIVAATASDLVGSGLVASLARPGGNITGSTEVSPDLASKRLELFKEAIPKLSRVAILSGIGPTSAERDDVQETQKPARHLKLTIQPFEARDPAEIEGAFAAMSKQRIDGVVIVRGSFTIFHRKRLAELALQRRLPSMCAGQDFVEDGCLMHYAPDLAHHWRRAAVFVDKILKGTKPADLPVEQPTKFEFVINLKTAKQIGLRKL